MESGFFENFLGLKNLKGFIFHRKDHKE